MSIKRIRVPDTPYSNADIDAFVEWLKETLIPDLMDSGNDATAEDFMECIEIIEQLRKERDARPPAVTD